MRFPTLALFLMAFPVAEIWILIALFSKYGWWVLFYLIVVAMLGWRLIQDEKLLLSGRMMQQLSQGNHAIKALFGTAKNMLAGILLIVPGVMTDVIAVILLLIPSARQATSTSQSSSTRSAANDDVIEGEFRRED